MATKPRTPRKRKAAPVAPLALDPIVETAAQLSFAPPTSACSALDARLMAEQAFDALAELRENAERLPELEDEFGEAKEAYEALDRQFDSYQDMLRDFLNKHHPGAWKMWTEHRAKERNVSDDVCELDDRPFAQFQRSKEVSR
jgi:hypothetical protein